MQKVAIGSGHLWLDLLDSFTVGLADEAEDAPQHGTVWAALTAEPDLLCLRFTHLSVDPSDPAAPSDLAAEILLNRRAKNLPVFQVGSDEAWFCEIEESAPTDPISATNLFWIIGWKKNKVVVQLSFASRDQRPPHILAATDDVRRIIESIAERPDKSPLTQIERDELDEDRDFILNILHHIEGRDQQLPKCAADIPPGPAHHRQPHFRSHRQTLVDCSRHSMGRHPRCRASPSLDHALRIAR